MFIYIYIYRTWTSMLKHSINIESFQYGVLWVNDLPTPLMTPIPESFTLNSKGMMGHNDDAYRPWMHNFSNHAINIHRPDHFLNNFQ